MTNADMWYFAFFVNLFFGIPAVFIVLKCLYWSKKSIVGKPFWRQWLFLVITNFFFVKEIFSGNAIGNFFYYHFLAPDNTFKNILSALGKSKIYLYVSDISIVFSITFCTLGLLFFKGKFINRGKYCLAKLMGKNPNKVNYASPLKNLPFLIIFLISFSLSTWTFFAGYPPVHWIEAFCHPFLMIFPMIVFFDLAVALVIKFMLWFRDKLRADTQPS